MDDGKKPAGTAVTKVVEILLVEHDLADVQRLEQALDSTGASFQLHVATTGDDAIARLRTSLERGEGPTFDVIVVDLHLPGSAARGLLAEIRCHDSLREIPVIALAAPLSETDSLEAFDLEAWLCIRKTAELPVFADRLRRAIRCCLGEYPLLIGSSDPVGQSRVAEALLFNLRPDRPRRRDEQPTAGRQSWQPVRRDASFWRRRSA